MIVCPICGLSFVPWFYRDRHVPCPDAGDERPLPVKQWKVWLRWRYPDELRWRPRGFTLVPGKTEQDARDKVLDAHHGKIVEILSAEVVEAG